MITSTRLSLIKSFSFRILSAPDHIEGEVVFFSKHRRNLLALKFIFFVFDHERLIQELHQGYLNLFSFGYRIVL